LHLRAATSQPPPRAHASSKRESQSVSPAGSSSSAQRHSADECFGLDDGVR
jgi:hypothetical protein